MYGIGSVESDIRHGVVDELLTRLLRIGNLRVLEEINCFLVTADVPELWRGEPFVSNW